MKRYLLDTCIVIEAAEAGHFKGLPRKVRAVLQDKEAELLISSVSITEIAIKTSIGKLNMPDAALMRAIDDLGLTHLPYGARHALYLYALPLHHREPFDRMLIATALGEGVPVVTVDRQFGMYGDLGLDVIG